MGEGLGMAAETHQRLASTCEGYPELSPADPKVAGIAARQGADRLDLTARPLQGRLKISAKTNNHMHLLVRDREGRGRDRRKIIFLVSDGSNSRHNQHTYEETLKLLLETDISVYSISVSHTIPGKSILQHGLGQADKYAVKTGGDTFYASKEDDLDRLYSEVTEEARNQYTLTFSPHGADKTHDYHTIEVRVRRPGLNVSAREGYYQSALAIAH